MCSPPYCCALLLDPRVDTDTNNNTNQASNKILEVLIKNHVINFSYNNHKMCVLMKLRIAQKKFDDIFVYLHDMKYNLNKLFSFFDSIFSMIRFDRLGESEYIV